MSYKNFYNHYLKLEHHTISHIISPIQLQFSSNSTPIQLQLNSNYKNWSYTGVKKYTKRTRFL